MVLRPGGSAAGWHGATRTPCPRCPLDLGPAGPCCPLRPKWGSGGPHQQQDTEPQKHRPGLQGQESLLLLQRGQQNTQSLPGVHLGCLTQRKLGCLFSQCLAFLTCTNPRSKVAVLEVLTCSCRSSRPSPRTNQPWSRWTHEIITADS